MGEALGEGGGNIKQRSASHRILHGGGLSLISACKHDPSADPPAISLTRFAFRTYVITFVVHKAPLAVAP